MTCSCNNTTVTPCTSSAGCVSTNYAKCIYYSGTSLSDCVTITNGDNLDTVISALATAICNVTPADLNWGSFDYGCYASDSWSTAQEFAEGLTSKVCAIDAGAGLLPSGTTIPAAAPSNIAGLTPGTSTIEETIEAIFEDATAHELFLTDGSVTQGCFAAVPTATNLADWLNWVRGSVCNIKTTLDSTDTDLDNRLSDVEAYVGSTNLIDNTDCLGGSSTDTLSDTVALMKVKVCDIDSTIASYPDFTNITLTWSACTGLYPAYGNTASLTTQLGRLLTQISKRTYSFSGDFTVTPSSCGNSVSLATSVAPFACSDLETCSIHNLGDVNDNLLGSGTGDKYKVLSWDITAGEWVPKNVTVTSTGGTVSITPSDNGATLDYNLAVNLTDGGNSDDTGLATPVDLVIGAASGGSRALSLKYNSSMFAIASTNTFTVAANTVASIYIVDTTTPKKISGVAYLGGTYDVTLSGTLGTGSSLQIGTVSAGIIPTGTARFFTTQLTDISNHDGIPALLYIDVSGNVFIKNTTTSSLGVGTYAITFSGLSYVV